MIKIVNVIKVWINVLVLANFFLNYISVWLYHIDIEYENNNNNTTNNIK